jgi:hypothetical protein
VAVSDLDAIKTIFRRMQDSPVANFSYTAAALTDDLIEGVDTYNTNNEQNVPNAGKTTFDTIVLDKGIRAQGASLPRDAVNHFFGRTSYNINKANEKIITLIEQLESIIAHNGLEYDAGAAYAPGDMCYTRSVVNGHPVYTEYERTSTTPPVITNISPDTTPAHWTASQERTSYDSELAFSAPGYKRTFSPVDLTGLDGDTYYPVVMDFSSADDYVQIIARVRSAFAYIGSGTYEADFGIISKFTGFTAHPADVVTDDAFYDVYAGTDLGTSQSPIGFMKLQKGKEGVLYLRGGAVYLLWNSNGSPFVLEASGYDNGEDPAIGLLSSRGIVYTPVIQQSRIVVPDNRGTGNAQGERITEAVNKGDMLGSIMIPRMLTPGSSLDSVPNRHVGIFLCPSSALASTIQDLPAGFPAGTPFILTNKGEPGGTFILQTLELLDSDTVFFRCLAGFAPVSPWRVRGHPVGCYYTQYPTMTPDPEEENMFNKWFPVALRPAALYGGTWAAQWEDTPVFFCTGGAKPLNEETRGKIWDDSAKVWIAAPDDGVQGDAIRNITGHSGIVQGGSSVGAQVDGAFVVDQDYVGPYDWASGASLRVFFNPSRIVPTDTTNHPVNRRMIIWQRTA